MNSCIGKTTCPYCGVGCGVDLDRTADAGLRASGDRTHPANAGRLCVKGSHLGDTLFKGQRLTDPYINGHRAEWGEAVSAIAGKIRQVVAEDGPDAFAFYLSGQLLTEDYYVANKFAKGFIGTANVDTNSRLCMASAVVAYKRAFGSDTVPCCYEDLELCDLLIMVGSNAAWTHPVLFQRIAAAKAVRPEMKVVVIDPRTTASCDLADLHLPLRPGTDALIFNYLLAETARRKAVDTAYTDQFTEGFAGALEAASLDAPSTEVAATLTGLEKSDLELLLQWWLEKEKTVSFYSQGVNQSSSGTDKCNAIINCHLATGRIGRPGMGPFSITGQPNAMGGREVGGLANQLAAHMDFSTPGAVDLVRRFWDAPVMAEQNGLKAVDLFQAVEQGKVRVLWIMSTNPMVSMPDSEQIRRALQRCEMVIVSDCKADTDTTVMADILLPAAPWTEKSGTVTNSERRISRQRALLPVSGNARPDWWAVCEVARAMGYKEQFGYQSEADIFREHAALSAFGNNGQRDFDIGLLSTLSDQEYDQLRPVQWPVTEQRPEGTERMFTDGRFFTPGGRARFIPVRYKLPLIATSEAMPFILNTGRVRDQWHTMTRTGDAGVLAGHFPVPKVSVHPEDAAARNIQPDMLVRLWSAAGELYLRADVSDSVAPGQLFMPIHWTRQFSGSAVVSTLIPALSDPLSGQPESKHAVAGLAPVKGCVYGQAVTLREPDCSSFLYWSRIPSDQVFITEFCLPEMLSTEAFRSFCSDLSGAGEWLEYENPLTGEIRLVLVSNGHAEAVFMLQTAPSLPSLNWISQRLSDTGKPLEEADYMALLAGTAVDVEDTGAIVCSCFQVGEKQILKAKDGGISSVEELGQKLKCGTNCGSCIPELRRIIAG